MSVIKVNNITNKTGIAGPSVAGIPVVDSSSHFVVPTGRTGQRYADGGENIVRDGLVLYLDAKYSYPGATGTNPDVYTWYDMSGNENHGELKNGVGYNSANGGSIVFDGTDDYLSLPINSSISPSQVTIEAWVYHTNASQSVSFIGGYGDTGVQGYWLGKNGGNWSFSTGLGGTTYNQLVGPAYASNTIIHLVGTFDGSTQRLYANGALFASFAMSGNISYSGVTPYIGQTQGLTATRYWTGNIFAYRIYNRALSAAEISQNFNAARSRYGI